MKYFILHMALIAFSFQYCVPDRPTGGQVQSQECDSIFYAHKSNAFTVALRYLHQAGYCHEVSSVGVRVNGYAMTEAVIRQDTPRSSSNFEEYYDSVSLEMEMLQTVQPECVSYLGGCQPVDTGFSIYTSIPVDDYIYMEVRKKTEYGSKFLGKSKAFLFKFDDRFNILKVYKESIHYR